MPIIYIIVGSIFSLFAVIVAVALSWSVPMLFVAYTVGGAVGIIVTAATALAAGRAEAQRPMRAAATRAEPVRQERLADVTPGEAVARDSASVVYLPEYRVTAARALFTRNQADRQRVTGSFGWPDEPPEELRLALLDLLSYERVRPEDIWDEVQDWLERHQAQCPMDVKAAQKRL